MSVTRMRISRRFGRHVVRLNAGLGQAYTPTLVGADGGVFAISNATLYAIRAS